MKLDKTLKTPVVLGSDCFRPYYNTIVDPAHDTSRFHVDSPPAVVVTPLSIRRFLLPMQAGGWFHLESIENAAGQNVPSGGLMKETLCYSWA